MSATHWLTPRRDIQRVARGLEVLLLVLVAAMLLGGAAVYVASGNLLEPGSDPAADALRERLLYLMLIGGFGLLLIFPMLMPALQAVRRQVGTDGHRVHLRLDDGRELTVSPAELRHTQRALLHRQWSFPLRNQKGRSLYADGEIEAHLLPLLDPTRALSPWQALRHQWRHRDALLIWPLASIAALLLLLALAGALQLAAPLP